MAHRRTLVGRSRLVAGIVALVGLFGGSLALSASAPDAHAAVFNYGQGYVLFAQDGGVFSFGDVGFHGSIYSLSGDNGESAEQWVNGPWVAGAVTADKGGYWAVGSDEQICAFGDAAGDTYKSTSTTPSKTIFSTQSCWDASSGPTNIVGIAAGGSGAGPGTQCPSTNDYCEYWLVGSDGSVYSFGGAAFYGSMGGQTLNAPIVSMVATPDRGGYWLVGSDGGVFAFGDATYEGSMAGKSLNAPIVGMAATPDGKGYWLVGSDGGVFSFGDAHYYGSMGGTTLAEPVVSVIASSDGGGYLEAAADGGIFTFGDFAYQGAQSGDGHSSTNSPANAVVAVSGS